ncbi:hypothetical protein KIS4809_2062 [Bacillus sp. ZZV12-4809]|nr:hypothetical protein KIS4809_2062 [Bacillus sp. ZZV12-4809]
MPLFTDLDRTILIGKYKVGWISVKMALFKLTQGSVFNFPRFTGQHGTDIRQYK